MTMRHAMAAAALAAALSACGGGGGDGTGTPTAPSVPDSASQSVTGMLAFLATLVGSDSDAQEPLDLATFAPPRPDDADAQALK